MFERLDFGEWRQIAPVLSFLLTFGVFVVLFVRTLLMRRDRAERLALLPLQSNEEGSGHE